MKRLIIAALLCAAPVLAQQPKETVTKLVTLTYNDPNAIRNVIAVFGVSVEPSPAAKALTISGPPANVEAALAAIAKLETPRKNVELTAWFVVGSDQPNLTGAAVPAEIRDVIAQLKNVFTFKDYRMLDTLSLRTRSGSFADTTGILTPGANPRLTEFSIRNASVSEDGATVRIDRMHAGLRIPLIQREGTAGAKDSSVQTKVTYMNTGIDQDIDVKEGQKVVVGRASLEGPEKALFVIMTARVIQ
jgi:hypothetical protein